MTFLDLTAGELAIWTAVLILAAYRLTRLVVLDEVIGELPDPDTNDRGTGLRRLIDTILYDDQGKERSKFADELGKLYTCTFCAGFWISLAVVCVWARLWPWELGVTGWVYVFAVAGGQSFINSRHNA